MSAETFNVAVRFILPHEEDFARGHWDDENFVVVENVPGDDGGLTKYGIDQASHPGVDIAKLTRDQAIAIYFKEWQKRGLDALPPKPGICCFDVWVNGGYAFKWLQTALNATRPQTAIPLVVDGNLGPATISAALLCNQDAVVKLFLEERDARFEALASARPSLHQFLNGWEQRDRDLAAYLSSPAMSEVSPSVPA